MNNQELNWDNARRWLALLIAVLALIGFACLLIALWWNRFDPVLTGMVTKNFVVIIGLPLAAITAFVVVTFFRQTEAPMIVKFLGLELSGPSGEVLLWLVIFAVTAMLIHSYWVT